MVLKIILPDFPVLWGVLKWFYPPRSARKTIGAALIWNRKHKTFSIYDQKSCFVRGGHRGQLSTHSKDCHVEWNDSQSGSKLTEDGSTANIAMATMVNTKLKKRWTSSMKDQLVNSVYTTHPVKYTTNWQGEELDQNYYRSERTWQLTWLTRLTSW